MQERSEMNAGKFTGESPTTDEHMYSTFATQRKIQCYLLHTHQSLLHDENITEQGTAKKKKKSLKSSWKTICPGQLQQNMHS